MGGDILKLLMESYEDVLIVKLKGELDHHGAKQGRDKIDSLYKDERCKNIVLDVRDLSFMDSSGIGLIMGRYKICRENGGELCIVNEGEDVERILKLAGILKIIKVYSSIDEALNNC